MQLSDLSVSRHTGSIWRPQDALLSLSAGLLAVSAVVAFVLQSYFRVDVPWVLSQTGDDGWCEPSTQGIGVHCAGDFHQFVGTVVYTPVPPDHPLLPAGYVVPHDLTNAPLAGPLLTAFDLFARLAGERLSLVVWLTLLAGCLLMPIVYAVMRGPRSLMVVTVVVLGALTMPFLVAVDRGHFSALAVPWMMLFSLAALSGHGRKAAVFAAVAAGFAPQLAGLAIVFIALRWFRALGWFALTLVGIVAGTFLLRGTEAVHYARGWLYSLLWQVNPTHQPLLLGYKGNVSLHAPGEALLRVVGVQDVGLWSLLGGVLLLMVLSGIVVWRGMRVPRIYVVVCGLGLTALSSLIVYPYHLGFALVVAALITLGLLPPAEPRALSGVRSGDKARIWALVIATSVSLAPLIIPLGLADPFATDEALLSSTGSLRMNANLWTLVVPAAWTCAMLLTFVPGAAAGVLKLSQAVGGLLGRVNQRTPGPEGDAPSAVAPPDESGTPPAARSSRLQLGPRPNSPRRIKP